MLEIVTAFAKAFTFFSPDFKTSFKLCLFKLGRRQLSYLSHSNSSSHFSCNWSLAFIESLLLLCPDWGRLRAADFRFSDPVVSHAFTAILMNYGRCEKRDLIGRKIRFPPIRAQLTEIYMVLPTESYHCKPSVCFRCRQISWHKNVSFASSVFPQNTSRSGNIFKAWFNSHRRF